MKYVFLHLKTRDGEREYNHESVHEMNKKVDIDYWAKDYCSDFWSGGSTDKLDEGEYEFFGGEIITKVYDVREISKEHYDILKQYL